MMREDDLIANGFTLIELLAAMVVGALLLVSLGWITGSLGREARGAERTDSLQQLNRAAPLLDRFARNAMLSGDGSSFDITQTSIAWDIPAPAALGSIGRARLELGADRLPSGEALVMRFFSDQQPDAVPVAYRSPITLVDGLRSIKFETGEANTGLIALTDKRGRSRTIALAPRIDLSGSCRFDPISLTCS